MDWQSVTIDSLAILVSGVLGFVASAYSRGKNAMRIQDAIDTSLAKVAAMEVALDKHIVQNEISFDRIDKEIRSNETIVIRLDAKLDAIKQSLDEQRVDMKQFMKEGCGSPKRPVRKSGS